MADLPSAPAMSGVGALAHRPNGSIAAAFLSAVFALLVLGIVQIRTHVDEAFKEQVFDLGRSWIPNAEGIGPYSGKETITLVAWLVSWLVLELLLRRRDVDLKLWFGVAMTGLVVAVLLVWPPVWHVFGP